VPWQLLKIVSPVERLGRVVDTVEDYRDEREGPAASSQSRSTWANTNPPSRRPDCDRTKLLEVASIAKAGHRAEAEFWRVFHADCPRILGGVLDAIGCARAGLSPVAERAQKIRP
jgi:hypothetical protein